MTAGITGEKAREKINMRGGVLLIRVLKTVFILAVVCATLISVFTSGFNLKIVTYVHSCGITHKPN